MANKTVNRICCVCRVLQPKADMIRVVRSGTEFQVQTENMFMEAIGPRAGTGPEFPVQTNQRLSGRGCCVCRNCLLDAITKKAFDRSFKCPVPREIYDRLVALQLVLRLNKDKSLREIGKEAGAIEANKNKDQN